MKKISLFFVGLYIGIGQAQLADTTQYAVEVVEVVEQEPISYEPLYETWEKDMREEVKYRDLKLDPKFKNRYDSKIFDYDRKIKKPERVDLPKFPIPFGLIKFLMYAILICIVGIVIYYIFKNLGEFRWGKPKNTIKVQTTEEISDENLDDIQSNNFEDLIAKAKAENDFRKAIRYYYLWILQKLVDRKLIKWNKDKTDLQYLEELKEHPIRYDFSKNAYIYDYAWYGGFELNQTEFDLAESLFLKTLKQIS